MKTLVFCGQFCSWSASSAWVFTEVGFSFRRIPRTRGPAPQLRWTKTKSTQMSKRPRTKMQGFGQEAKEKIGDRADKVKEPERRP